MEKLFQTLKENEMVYIQCNNMQDWKIENDHHIYCRSPRKPKLEFSIEVGQASFEDATIIHSLRNESSPNEMPRMQFLEEVVDID